ncbi:hypothetical protein [Haloplanus halobius]|uniref:hypothetical protein n=1 Tax=Haloplanus halobius TaxID=2934938 RepID=UPI00200BACE3|nr:hypothetical protein [Haloplanus sp. XH21]
MEVLGGLKRWKEAIALFLLCVVFATLQWEVLRGFVIAGPSVPDTLYDGSLLVMLLITFGALVHELRRTASA